MILSVTVNPMLEQLYEVPGFAVGRSYRLDSPGAVIGSGKPLNVTRALRDLGEEAEAVVALGGAAGAEIAGALSREGIPLHRVDLAAESRRGFTLFGGGTHSSVYGPPPEITDAEVDALVEKVASLLPVRFLVIGGSTPRPDIYARLCGLGAEVVLDTYGSSLLNALEAGSPFLAKPNLKECRKTFGTESVEEAAARLQAGGARWAVVTDEGGKAAFWLGDTHFQVSPPEVEVVHSVGCGDALCAGLLHAVERDPADAVAFAMACGAHAASRPEVARLDSAACEALALESR